ncbi:DNA-binding transcriptional dual regulator Crp [Clostridium sp. N3C]|uniref:Crp/Fnr family transcriptional regulator n=1 Tax=Clostridium sp. N3C TaxID=1776758 RepID=UPI00092DEF4D|nr:Crp/Fnr family transcriptional regulator [Clostridium sp. N3C]SCN22065.1 DNA-binding transcriptional dual regulator Crp [Clostridium sp. N3C]
MNKYINILKTSDLFCNLENEEISLMLENINFKINEYSKNQYIVNTGDAIEYFGTVLEGQATILKEKAQDEFIMTIAKAGDLFGEMFIYSSHHSWPVTVKVQNYCKVLLIRNSSLIDSGNSHNSWYTKTLQNLLKIISDRAFFLNKKVEYLSIKSIRSKICAYLWDQYKKTGDTNITLSLNRNELASFLNVSRPSMSREICKLRDEGVINFHLSTFKIKKIEALKELALQ